MYINTMEYYSPTKKWTSPWNNRMNGFFSCYFEFDTIDHMLCYYIFKTSMQKQKLIYTFQNHSCGCLFCETWLQKGHKRIFWCDGDILILTSAWLLWLYTFVKRHQNKHLRSIYFISFKLLKQKLNFKKMK